MTPPTASTCQRLARRLAWKPSIKTRRCRIFFSNSTRYWSISTRVRLGWIWRCLICWLKICCRWTTEVKTTEKNASCEMPLRRSISTSRRTAEASILVVKGYVQGGISSSVLSVFFTDNCYKLLKSLHLIGWEQICQWKTLTKRLMKCPPLVTLSREPFDKSHVRQLFVPLFTIWRKRARVNKNAFWDNRI